MAELISRIMTYINRRKINLINQRIEYLSAKIVQFEQMIKNDLLLIIDFRVQLDELHKKRTKLMGKK